MEYCDGGSLESFVKSKKGNLSKIINKKLKLRFQKKNI
jgi:hypothetical protein